MVKFLSHQFIFEETVKMLQPQDGSRADYSAREAARRLLSLVDELRPYHIAAETLEELEVVGERFQRHLQELPVCLERIETFVRRMR
jgi:hypothetical protein